MAKTQNREGGNNENADHARHTPPNIGNKKESNAIKLARLRMWQAIIIAIITTTGGGIFAYIGVSKKQSKEGATKANVSVPISIVNAVDKLPAESNNDDYMLLKDISIFDLRQWRPVLDSLKNTRYSPAGYTNYLHVKKTRPLDKIIIHYATSGYAIDMRCITHDYEVVQRKKPISHEGENVKEYALTIDVSKVEINKEFLIVVESTYWNGFGDLKHEDASTYTDDEIHGLNELGLIVFFPENKPFFQATKMDRDNGTGVEKEYRGFDEFYTDQNKKFIYWDIKERSPNHHYKLKWTW